MDWPHGINYFILITSESADDTTLFGHRIFVFGCHLVFDGFSPFEVHLYPMFSADSFDAFTSTFCIRYHYVASFLLEFELLLVDCMELLLLSLG